MKNLVKTILFLLTAALLFASMLQQWFHWRDFEPLNGVVVEQTLPKLTFASCSDGSFQRQAEKHLKQHFGYREPLVRFYNQYLWDFFKKSPLDGGAISIGKSNWIYEPWVVSDYYQNQFRSFASDSATMANMLSDEALRVFQVQKILEPYGTHLFVCMVPAKDLVYPEYLPRNKDTKHDGEPKISARFFNEEEYTRLGVNHLNLEQYFLQMKDTASFLLFPQTGTHWTQYAALYAADTMIRYMEHLGDMNMNNLVFGPRVLDNARGTDEDLESLLNLIRPIEKPQYYYGTVTTDNDSTAEKPKIITVGDSFWWTIVNQIPMFDLFSSFPYWYYNSTIYFDNAHQSVNEVDMVEELLSSDFIILFYSSTQLYRLNNDFTKKALMALCFDPEDIDSVANSIEQYIRTDSIWLKGLEERAIAQDQPLEVMIHDEALWHLNNYPERYLPKLANNVPAIRSKRVEEYLGLDYSTFLELEVEKIIEEIKNDETKLAAIQEKAVQNNKTLEQALIDDARWIVNYKLEHGTLHIPKNIKK